MIRRAAREWFTLLVCIQIIQITTRKRELGGISDFPGLVPFICQVVRSFGQGQIELGFNGEFQTFAEEPCLRIMGEFIADSMSEFNLPPSLWSSARQPLPALRFSQSTHIDDLSIARS